MLRKTELPPLRKKTVIQAHNQKFFRARGGFVKLGHSNKDFDKNSSKKGPAWKKFEVFSLRYS